MSGLNLELDFRGLGFTRELMRLQKKGKKLQTVLDTIGQYLVSDTQSKFIDNKIKPETKKSGYKNVVEIVNGKKVRKKIEIKGQTLLERGHLMQSITHHVSSDNALEVGSNVVYAAIHQFGGDTGRYHSAHIPPRPYLEFSEKNRAQIKKILINYLKT
jgi:phage virion morphogenesis protein